MEITKWMKENVFKKADRLTPKEWIREITGNDICVEPYLSYLENKYALLYDINIR